MMEIALIAFLPNYFLIYANQGYKVGKDPVKGLTWVEIRAFLFLLPILAPWRRQNRGIQTKSLDFYPR